MGKDSAQMDAKPRYHTDKAQIVSDSPHQHQGDRVLAVNRLVIQLPRWDRRPALADSPEMTPLHSYLVNQMILRMDPMIVLRMQRSAHRSGV